MAFSSFCLDADMVVNKPLLTALDEIAICNICKNIVWNPMECNKCEHCFCKTCIDNWLNQSRTCPFKCNNMTFNESRMARSMLSNLLFKCSNCGEVIKYENCELHSNTCSYKHNNKYTSKRSKFDKYDEVEIETHEHALTIIKDAKMRKNKKSTSNNNDNPNNNTKYYWTCSICAKYYSLDIRSAVCETCTNYEVCEDCISHKAIQWLVHIII